MSKKRKAGERQGKTEGKGPRRLIEGQLYLSSSSSVLLMETALFAVDGYRMLSTHTLGTKPSSDECSNIAVTPNASTHYTRTRSLCFQLWRVYAGPFSSV
ncbi:hypothetical protein ROHU_033598 [Labeo rohita]|uniref:Uncharacterized protein n=1 Tax=Labeo rohita TaxID=84645 RepID=A0A498LA66_LABRO|nr:hypothetical protein ROHU_033598 [Labeo rohita]